MSNREYPLFTIKNNCQDCYKCVRNCPCKAIRVENGHATVVPELCVLCGRCVTDCPAHAKHVRDDLTKTKRLFNISDNWYFWMHRIFHFRLSFRNLFRCHYRYSAIDSCFRALAYILGIILHRCVRWKLSSCNNSSAVRIFPKHC